CYDPSNLHHAADRPDLQEVTAQLRGEEIGLLHFKQSRSGEQLPAIGPGEIDWLGQLQALRRKGYAGPQLFEIPAGPDIRERLYEVIAHIVGKGAELRALSAIDVALWDIFGQATGLPVWQLLGGAARDRIRTYNTCGGPGYGRTRRGGTGYGTDGQREGRYEDLIAFMERADELATDLLSEGITGMKIWPLDFVVHAPGAWDRWRDFRGAFDPSLRSLGGQSISNQDLARGLEPFRKIREAVGDRMEIMVEGHGFWSLPAAKKIAHALEEFRPCWLEDLMRADDIDALAELRQ